MWKSALYDIAMIFQPERMSFFSIVMLISIYTCNADVIVLTSGTLPKQLNCTGSNSSQNYTWHIQGKNSTTTAGNVFYIYNTYSTGTYQCSTPNSNLTTFTVTNFSNPLIPHRGQSLTFTEGDVNKSLECFSYSDPTPTFTWSFLPSEDMTKVPSIISNSNNYKITSDGTGKSVLTIISMSAFNRGTYFCNATNTASNTEVSILVRVHSRLAPLWPFLGIVCEILVVVCIMIVVRKRPDNTKQVETTQPLNDATESAPGNTNNSSIRQRASNRT